MTTAGSFSLNNQSLLIILSLFGEVVIVDIDATTQLRCLLEALEAHFVTTVVRNVKLEEASVGNGESIFVEASRQTNLMLSRKLL